ncbi:hypothetical protein MTO96_018973 [Rhipicephalus appendiculatus]
MARKHQCATIVLAMLALAAGEANFWERPGCHKVGHTRRVSIPECVEFDITTNACRGFCTSYSIPSPEFTLRMNRNQRVTSFGQCCNIMDTEDRRPTQEGEDYLRGKQPMRDRDSRPVTGIRGMQNRMPDRIVAHRIWVKVQVRCLDGHRDLVFKSAKSCACFHCKKN